MRRLLRENGLSIVWLGLFFVTLIFGQSVVGQREYNNDQQEHGRAQVGYVEYIQSAHFVEATMRPGSAGRSKLSDPRAGTPRPNARRTERGGTHSAPTPSVGHRSYRNHAHAGERKRPRCSPHSQRREWVEIP